MKQLLTIHLHMPKTAGTTFKSILRKNYEPHETLDLYETFNNHGEVAKRLKKLDLQDVAWLNCHLSFGIHQYIRKPSAYLTFLRDPVERIISEYFFILQNQNHGLHERIKNMSLVEFQNEESNRNKQCKIIIGKPLEESVDIKDVKQAKNVIEKHFTFVGITEMFEESLFIMKKIFNWYNTSYTKMNVTQNRQERSAISDDLVQLIRNNNSVDIALYEYVKQQLEKQIACLDKRDKRQLNLLLQRSKGFK